MSHLIEEWEDLWQEFYAVCGDVDVSQDYISSVYDLLESLRIKEEAHYLHCLRVGLLAAKIGKFIYLPQKPLLLSGAMHDIGKREISSGVLVKSSGWNASDEREVHRHAVSGWHILKDRFPFTADIIVQHHRFQNNGYPKRLPSKLHKYSESTKLLILDCARVVALADVYDALHRVNDKFGETRALTPEEIKEKMFELNKDKELLVAALYQEGILK